MDYKHGKKTFVFLLHDADKFGDTPVFKHEIVEEIDMTHSKAIKLMRALHEFYRYITTGEEKYGNKK